LSDYVVVAQDQPLIEHFSRQQHGQWLLAASVGEMAASVEITSIHCTLRLSNVYDRLVFPDHIQEGTHEM
jgi:hypothetical protein